MGTLGCVNDMLQRDKMNRELRKLNRERMKEHHKYLVSKGGHADLPDVSVETLEEIRKNTIEKEQADKVHLLKVYLVLGLCFGALFLLGLCCYKLFG
ncbi:hypothetical protein [uncultured Bacteroides sp.]|uniref:hypothetical protein n=1 Tax=uncultured Bacteroides sp. TaxID=162156 RepID=UPI0025EEA3F8|nr:hypothetical protein [uncultured Bacteroides sp.]